MQTSVTDTSTGATIIRDVDRIEILQVSSPSTRQILVYFKESVKMGNKQYGQPIWLDEPLIVDASNSKIVQVLQLFKEVIENAETARIKENHKITHSSSPSPSPTPNPAASIPSIKIG